MMIATEKQLEFIAGLRVIVVDDVLDSKDLLEMYLRQLQVQVRAVDSARNALTAIADFQPDIVISDIYMPEKDGYWLIQQLNQLYASSENKIPAIAVTAAAKQEDREKLVAAGYDGYLAKPFLLEDLTSLIVEIIAKK